MGTKNDPGNINCYAKAEGDEPIFILLARDPRAPKIVRAWAAASHTTQGTDKILEAFNVAATMEKWYAENREGHCKQSVMFCGGTKKSCTCECNSCEGTRMKTSTSLREE